MNIQVSVVVATHNRCKYLTNALEGLNNQSLDKKLYEVIVVDNVCTDATKALVYSKMAVMDNLKYVYESKPGLNEARNAGLKEAKGLYIAYLDDDAVPHNKWAEKILEAFIEISPQPGVVGGPTLPVWEVNKPTWWIPKFDKAISMVDYGDEKRFLQGREFLVGANMVFLKSVLESIGGFMPGLGRVKNKLISGEETAAIEKVKRLGYGVYYDPEIAVDHFVSSSRLTKKWFIKRYYWQGYSEALIWQLLDSPSFKLWLQKTAYILYGFLRNPVHIFYLVRKVEQPERFWFKCILHARIGYLVGLFRYYSK